MPRNKGYREDNEPGNGQPGNRQRNVGSNGREQEVFFTDGSHECITMQPMASSGPMQMQRSSLPQGYGQPGGFAPHGNFNHGQDTAGHSAQQGHILPSMIFIVVKRILSVAVLIFNDTLSWLKYFEWMGMIDLPEIVVYLGKSSKTEAVECSPEAPVLPTIYGAFCLIGTLYALFQITNTIGETVLEYHVRKTAKKYEDGGASQGGLPQHNAKTDPVPEANGQKHQEKDNRCACLFHGFQLVHGWVETVAAMILGDFPQIIVIAFSSYYCTVDAKKMLFNALWAFVKYIKNKARKASCKQKYKPSKDCLACCTSCFMNCCCTCKCTLLFCIMWIWRLCPMGDESRCEMKPICSCRCGPCMCDGPCNVCGRQNEDPEWAAKLIIKLEALYKLGFVVVVLIQYLAITDKFHYSSSKN